MSLLLDARKKSQQARSSQDSETSHTKFELSLEEYPTSRTEEPEPPPIAQNSDEMARKSTKNLFQAKSPAIRNSRLGGINRNLLIALGGTILLLAAGAGYLWYVDSASSAPPIRPRIPAAAPAAPAPAPIAVAPEDKPTTETRASVPSGDKAPVSSAGTSRLAQIKRTPRRKSGSTPQRTKGITVQPKQVQLIDPLINNAYLAYRRGNLDESRQMYLEVLAKDARNSDALLGLAAIAQLQGDDGLATQYYLRVLTLDPRNAVAHAGMSALSTDEHSESRLKSLLREQRDSAALHFALGNVYASQSRWSEAQAAYFNAYTLDSKNAELAFNLAVSLDHLGQNNLAIQYYQLALQLDPTGSTQRQESSLNRAKINQRVKELTR